MRSILPSSSEGFCARWLGIIAGPAVAQADVEIAVGAEREVAAVVIRERLPMKAGPSLRQRRSKRDAGSATSGLPSERRKRATTVLPDRSVKLTKNRPLVRVGRKGQPQQPLLAVRTRRHRSGRESLDETPCRSRTTRMRPPCSTTN